MKIAIDARSLTTRPTGVGHSLMAAVNVWSGQRPDIEFTLMAHKPIHPQASSALRVAPNIRFVCCPASVIPGNGLWWLLHAFPAKAWQLGATHLWGASGVLPPFAFAHFTTLLTVNDLVFLSLPETMAWRTRVAYGLLAGRSITHADLIWTISHFTAREVERHYPKRRADGFIVGCGLNPLRQQEVPDDQTLEALKQRFGVGDRTLLFVGTLEPRKNLPFLLSLMPALARNGWRLLVVGCSGWGKSPLASTVQAPDYPSTAVHFCDYVTDLELQALYRTVTFFISTSLMEGFGLPQLEAMSAGCPVIAAANSAVIEVVADGGLLIEGWNQAHWIEQIEQAYTRRPALQAAARQNAERHSVAPACLAVGAALDQAA